MVGNLTSMAQASPQVFQAIMEKSWIRIERGDPNGGKDLVIRYLAAMTHRNESVALRVLNLPFLDTMDWGDSTEVKFLLDLMSSDWEGLQQLLTHPAVLNRDDGNESSPMSLLYLDMKGPAAAEKIANLPWVKDGLHDFEENGVGLLQQLAQKSPTVFQAVLSREREWIPPQTGMDNASIQRLINLATINEYAALQLIEMPFMESIAFSDGEAFRRLVELAEADPSGLDYVLSHPTFIEGITDEQAVEVSLVYLEWSDPEASQLIRDLAWVADGIAYRPPSNIISIHDDMSRFESGAVMDLIELSQRSREVFLPLVGKPWFQDELTRNSYEAFSTLWELGSKVPDAALRIVNMPFLDEVDRDDDGTLETIRDLYWHGPDKIYQLIDRPELQGGITEEKRFIVRLLALELEDSSAAERIYGLPWVENGLDHSEEAGTLALIFTATETDWFFPELVERDWVVDGLDKTEVSAIWSLQSVAGKGNYRTAAAAAVSLLDMPFLESVEPSDAAALNSLSRLVWKGEGELGYLEQVLTHPSLESGIKDEDSPLLAFLDRVVEKRPETLDSILDSGRNRLVTRTIELPYTGRVDLAVMEEDKGRLQTLDLLEQTVRVQEEFMMEPFPSGFAGLLAVEAAGGGGPTGIVSVTPLETGNPNLIATLAAYTYWPLPHPTWMSGGAVFLLTWMTVVGPPDAGAPPITFECDLARNAAELERLDNELGGGESESEADTRCHYDMGMGLYLHLYTNLDNKSFHEGFRRLYQSVKWEGNQDCSNPDRGLCLVREAFVNHASAANAAIAEEIIDHWYYGDPLGKDN